MSENSENGRPHPVKSGPGVPYPDDAVTLALSVIIGGGSVRQACRAVGEEFGRTPDPATVWKWAQHSEEAFTAMRPAELRESRVIVGEVLRAWAKRALEAATAKDKDGNYLVSHSQVMVPYGIAKDAVKVIEDTVNPRAGNQMNVQFNLVTGNAGAKPETIEGEAREKD